MAEYSEDLNRQYGQKGLGDRIITTFERAGFQTENLTLDDLALIDQLHAGGIEATRYLAERAGMKPGMTVLDLGSGLGGPARVLAAEFRCQVTGVDITEDFVLASRQLTDLMGLTDSASFLIGNALDLDFKDASFDAVWIQNSVMNIENKAQVFREAHRVLKGGGVLALESIMADRKPESRFPVFWADRPEISFLTNSAELQEMMAEIGFAQLSWEDITEKSAQSNRKLLPVYAEKAPEIGMHIFTDNLYQKIVNTLTGLEDGTYRYIYAVYKKSA